MLTKPKIATQNTKKKSENIWFSFFFFNTTINKTDVIQSCQWKTNFGIKKALEKYFFKQNKTKPNQNETHTHKQKNLQTLPLKKKKVSSFNLSDPNL